MSVPSFVELYSGRYDTLNEDSRVTFLLSLKKEWLLHGNEGAGCAFKVLVQRWALEPIT